MMNESEDRPITTDEVADVHDYLVTHRIAIRSDEQSTLVMEPYR